MKALRFLFILLISFFALSAQGQTAAGISDEDLERYARTMDSVKVMQETLTQIITETVQKNTVMTVARYNELFKLAGDEAKLAAANATDEEKGFIKEVADLRQYNIGRINATYQALAKEYIGLKAFNAIKKSLETDENLKARYESISEKNQGSKPSGTDSKG
jgi:hypothetical protein